MYLIISRQIIENVAKNLPKNILIWGTSGTGKTLLLTQILGIKISYYKMLGRIKLNIIVTSFQSLDFKSQLLKYFKENYLTQLDNMDEVRFVSLSELCSGLLKIALNKEPKMPANSLSTTYQSY
jgi:DNA replication protein DnaC